MGAPATELVVARFNEGLGWVGGLAPPGAAFERVTVYNKGEELGPGGAPPGAAVLPLPNVGRESHTHLWHLVQRYDSLAGVTVFAPGSVALPHKWTHARRTAVEALARRDSVFVGLREGPLRAKWGGFSLDAWACTDPANRAKHPDAALAPCPERPFGAWYDLNFPEAGAARGEALFGTFALSAEDARRRPRAFYRHLLDRYLSGHSNPEAGHYFERAWLAVFHPVPERKLLAVAG